jgi:hypothetical protein
MTGSLLQIVSTGIKDVFLTIDPQITFFKIVYLRFTPFAIDLKEENFNICPNFGEESFCELSKNGDLISNIFLKIKLPNVHISNTIDSNYLTNYSSNKIIYNGISQTVYDIITSYSKQIIDFTTFISSATVYLIQIQSLINNITSTYSTIINAITAIQQSNNDIYSKYQTFNANFNNITVSNIIFNFDLLNNILNNYTNYSNSIYNSDLTTNYKNILNEYLKNYQINQTIYLKYLIDQKDKFTNILNTNNSTYYNFSWVNKIGFAILNNITIEIGGQIIDQVNSDILNMWYELNNPIEKDDLLNKMIGNIELLTSYDNTLKPSYILYIPIPFWFCKYKSQPIPCTALKYHDIIINVKLNELYKCCYFEPDEYKLQSNININSLIQIQDVSLLVEYIHLGDDERKKFSSFTYETLIEQHKMISFNYLNTNNTLLSLDFVNPVREFIWVIQKMSNTNNLLLWNDYDNVDVFYGLINTHDNSNNIIINILNVNLTTYNLTNYLNYKSGYIRIIHSKYYNGTFKILNITNNTITINNNYIYQDNIKCMLYLNKYNKTYNIINNENIQIYGKDLITVRDKLYFTHIQNFQHHTRIPNNIHTYSFCINTEEFQPSGSLNFSVVDNKNLNLELNDIIINQINQNNDSLIVKILARSHNILKIQNGIGKIEFGI